MDLKSRKQNRETSKHHFQRLCTAILTHGARFLKSMFEGKRRSRIQQGQGRGMSGCDSNMFWLHCSLRTGWLNLEKVCVCPLPLPGKHQKLYTCTCFWLLVVCCKAESDGPKANAGKARLGTCNFPFKWKIWKNKSEGCGFPMNFYQLGSPYPLHFESHSMIGSWCLTTLLLLCVRLNQRGLRQRLTRQGTNISPMHLRLFSSLCFRIWIL